MKRKILLLLPLLVGATVLLTLGRSSQDEIENSKPIERNLAVVKLLPVEPADGYSVERDFVGIIQPTRSSKLSFLRSGLVRSMDVDIGQKVKKGQLLATLDQADISASESVLYADLARAEARLTELRRGPRVEPRRAAVADVARVKASLELAEQKLRRRQSLYARGAIPKESLDQFEAEVRILKQELASTQQRSTELEVGTRPEVISQAAADAQRVRAQLQQLQVQRRDSALRAPYDGFITRRLVDEGTVVSPGTPIFDIEESRIYEAWIDLPSSEAPPKTSELALNESTVQGRLIAEPRRVDAESLTQTARYAIPSGKPGESVTMTLERFVPQPGFWVPTASLTEAVNGLWACYTLDSNGKVVSREVEVLYREDDRVLVRGSIQADEQIIAEGLDGVVPGQQVAAR